MSLFYHGCAAGEVDTDPPQDYVALNFNPDASMVDEDFRFPQKPDNEPATGRQSSSKAPSQTPSDMSTRAIQLADELRAHARIEASQGQLSPTDNALMLRIESFLRNEVGAAGRSRR